jgi:hypothetical protein
MTRTVLLSINITENKTKITRKKTTTNNATSVPCQQDAVFEMLPGASCPDKPNKETIRMVAALADVIAPRDHEIRVVARPMSVTNLEGLLAQRGDQ